LHPSLGVQAGYPGALLDLMALQTFSVEGSVGDDSGVKGLLDHAVRPKHLKRYKDLGRLVLRYGGATAVRRVGLEPALEDLHDDPADIADGKPEQLTDDLERMGPTFVKLGQVLSTRPDVLPQPYLDALARLQDKVEQVPFEEIEKVVQDELGVRISKAFKSFEVRPIAAASLGQVHRAELRDGRVVAVKVQRPGIRDTIRTDLEALAELAELADGHTESGRRYSFTSVLDEFRAAMLVELDYREEAKNLNALADSLLEFPNILVPRPIWDYSTERVLTMEYVEGTNLSHLSPVATLEADRRGLLEELFQAYLHQALVTGLVHADPHPGNVFLTPDGKLALIDVGMVLRVPDGMRERMLKLLLFISDGNGEDAARLAEEMGDTTPRYDRKGFAREVARMTVRVTQDPGSQVQMGRMVLAIARCAGEHGLKPPRELTLIGKTLLALDGIANLLDPSFDPHAAIRANALSLAQRRLLLSTKSGSVLTSLLETKDFMQDLPWRVNRALDAVGEGDLEVRVRVIDEAQLLTGLHQMANRLSRAVILAALIVGASLLMRVPSTLTVLGYPIIAILFFLAAAAGGVALLWSIWRGDRKTERTAQDGRMLSPDRPS
jgi:ubiquinone biosynthesis protein